MSEATTDRPARPRWHGRRRPARDEDGNKVALKRLTLQGSASEIARAHQRLMREAEVLRRLRHPNVVGLLDVVDKGDEIVLVMPYMAGGSLAERVAQHGPAPAGEVERQAMRLLGALASAHRAGIVHRDIKPANVLFDERGALSGRLRRGPQPRLHPRLRPCMVVGTPGFMAPEQAWGEAVSPATDVFSLGATLLFATGEGPWAGRPRSARWGGQRQGRPGTQAAASVAAPPAAGHARASAGTAAQRRGPRRGPPGHGARHGSATRPRVDRRTWALLGGGAVLALVAGAVVALARRRSGPRGLDRRRWHAGRRPGRLRRAPLPALRPVAAGALHRRLECIDDHDDYDRAWENGW